jgi:hypothetical protein
MKKTKIIFWTTTGIFSAYSHKTLFANEQVNLKMATI